MRSLLLPRVRAAGLRELRVQLLVGREEGRGDDVAMEARGVTVLSVDRLGRL